MRRRLSEPRLGWLLCAPAVTMMLLVAAWPILDAAWLSLFRNDLRFPDMRRFIGLENYASVLGSMVWWRALANTLLITVVSVACELLLGLLLALLMQRLFPGRQALRTAVLVPYAIITVVAALAWRFAFDPVTGFVNGLLGLHGAWLAGHWTALAVIIMTEIWKTTPFMALLLLAGLMLVPRELLAAARIDGANAWQRFRHITLPLLLPAMLAAMLFRTVDAFRIFDTVYIQTRGAQHTATVSVVGYDTLIARLNLGLGSAVAVLVFAGAMLIAAVFVRAFLRVTAQQQGDL